MKNRNDLFSQVLIYAEEGVWWESCKIISTNLKKAYEKSHLQLNWQAISIEKYDQDLKEQTGYLESWCRNLLKHKPSRITFIDFHPHQARVAQCLAEGCSQKEKIEFVFHIYGDFTLLSSHWFKAQKSLKGHSVRFFCASDRQVKFLRNLVLKPEGRVELCPFPVDTEFFTFEPKLREKARKELQLSNDDRLLLYTGRISLQKNVTSLVQTFPDLVRNNPKIKKFIIAGDFDDIGGRLLGLSTPLGWAFANMQNELAKLPKSLQSKIQFTGQLNRQDLKKLLHAGDLFCSLSLYHDEDFGMSPAEALACGVPCVLSDWGGYSSFARKDLSCRLIPVRLSDNGYQLDLLDFESQALALMKNDFSNHERLRQSQAFQNDFSIDSIAKHLENLHSERAPNFLGFQPKLKTLQNQVFRNLHPKAGTFYEDIYHSYFARGEN